MEPKAVRGEEQKTCALLIKAADGPQFGKERRIAYQRRSCVVLRVGKGCYAARGLVEQKVKGIAKGNGATGEFQGIGEGLRRNLVWDFSALGGKEIPRFFARAAQISSNEFF